MVTIWPSTTVPGTVDGGPDSAVELGVKFRSDVAGKITGIRFYKATANTGTHVGNLWSSTGTLLGSVTFSNETASGWQQMLLATPVAITSNTVYVASYHCTIGHYSEDDNYFLSNGVNNPPLHALTNGVSGGNGVYAYGASSVFPTNTYTHGQLLGGRGVPGRSCADVDFDCVDSGEPDNLDRSVPAVHGDGDLFGQQHAEHHEPGDVEVVEYGGGYHQCRRRGHGGFCRHDDHLGDAGGCDQQHSAHGQDAADADVHRDDALQPDHLSRGPHSVHGDRDLLGQQHTES